MQPKKGQSLGAHPSHQRLMLRNLARSLFEHERVKTTEAKAKMLRPFAERLITKAKGGTVHDRRQVLSDIEDREVVTKLFEEIAGRFEARNGGYTRILKIGPRNGDGAPMALIELVDGSPAPVQTEEEARRRRLRRPRRRGRGDTPQDKPVLASGEGAAVGSEPPPGTRRAAERRPEAEAEQDVAEEGVGDTAAEQADTGQGSEGAGGAEPRKPHGG